jgi:hypothetical protein
LLTARVAAAQPLLRRILGNMIGDIELDGGPISALPPKTTSIAFFGMPALGISL